VVLSQEFLQEPRFVKRYLFSDMRADHMSHQFGDSGDGWLYCHCLACRPGSGKVPG
jgi:hypothetical protein